MPGLAGDNGSTSARPVKWSFEPVVDGWLPATMSCWASAGELTAPRSAEAQLVTRAVAYIATLEHRLIESFHFSIPRMPSPDSSRAPSAIELLFGEELRQQVGDLDVVRVREGKMRVSVDPDLGQVDDGDVPAVAIDGVPPQASHGESGCASCPVLDWAMAPREC